MIALTVCMGMNALASSFDTYHRNRRLWMAMSVFISIGAGAVYEMVK